MSSLPDSIFAEIVTVDEVSEDFGPYRWRRWSIKPFDGATEFRRILTMADFPSTGNEEAEWIEHQENACEFCGGSGHKDDAKEAATDIASLRRELERFRSERSYVVGCNDGWDEAIEQAAQVVESFQVPKSPHEGDLKPRRHPSQTSVLIAAAIRKLAEPK